MHLLILPLVAAIPAIAAGIGAVGSIAGNILGANAQKKVNQQNQDFAMAQTKEAEDYNTRMLQMQMDYNNPVNAMARMRAAGLNPNLVAGGTPSGNVASVPTVNPQSSRSEAFRPDLSGVSNSIMNYVNAKAGIAAASVSQEVATNTAADTALKITQELLTRAGIPKLGAETAKTTAEANTLNTLLPYVGSKAGLENAKLLADTEMTVNENERRAAANSVNIKEALQRIVSMRVDNGLKMSQTDLNNATRNRLDVLTPQEGELLKQKINSEGISRMLMEQDLNLKEKGIQPHDGAFSRSLMEIARRLIQNLREGAGSFKSPTVVDR